MICVSIAAAAKGMGRKDRGSIMIGAFHQPPYPDGAASEWEPASVPLFRAERWHCRWPLWHGETRPTTENAHVCGARPVEGSSYCAEHQQRAINRQPPRRSR